MSPEEIRDLYVETLEAELRSEGVPHYGLAEKLAVALDSKGLMARGVEGRYIGRGMLRRTRLVTDWKEPEG
ncbi:hypothetical protein [Nocardia asiatica]|uniref:hypothetical protein n=1 Tax=Nocardia asiatica TaxID=209252 RepID=UPI00245626AA|nr:hypothetical protein [Nocardia asiatica]